MPSSPPREDAHISLQNALTDLENTARIPTKQRAVKITRYVDRVCAGAYEHGLSQDHLAALIDLVTLPSELDQASTTTIIKSFYPAGKVPDECVIKVVNSLGHGVTKAGFPTQTALLKWLIMIHDALENPKILSHLYAVLFNLLDTIAIRAPLCHLLALITRRKHVRPFRIQMLLELARKVGNEPSLIGLIRVYKDYYPDVIVGQTTSGRSSVFIHPDKEWRERLSQIQEKHMQRTQNEIIGRQQSFKVIRRGIMGVKRSKISVVPEVQTSHAQETSVTLEEIENVNDFIGKLEKIELPNQLVAALGDPLLQKLLQLKSTDAIFQRLDNWLLAFFEDQLQVGTYSSPALLDMFAAVREYARLMKHLPVAGIRYLKSFLLVWNGTTGREVILDLLSYLPLEPFEAAIYHSTFQPLEEAVLDNMPDSQLALLNFYTSLLRRWEIILLSTTPLPTIAATTIAALSTHINRLTLTILQTTTQDYTVSTHMAILTFYETTASLLSQPTLQAALRITTPPSSLIYSIPFTTSLAVLSRLCAILAVYKRAFEFAMAKATAPPSSSTNPSDDATTAIEPYPKPYVNHFNGFLMDICNFLWRSRAFNTSDMNALGCLLPPPLLPVLTSYVASLDTGLTLPSLFSLSYSPILCNLSISYVRELEDAEANTTGDGGGAATSNIKVRHAGPVTQRSLVQLAKDGGLKLTWANYRLGVLQYLERKGVPGVGELMYNTMKHLMTAREGGGGASGAVAAAA